MLGSFFSGKMKHGQDFLRERDKDDKWVAFVTKGERAQFHMKRLLHYWNFKNHSF